MKAAGFRSVREHQKVAWFFYYTFIMLIFVDVLHTINQSINQFN